MGSREEIREKHSKHLMEKYGYTKRGIYPCPSGDMMKCVLVWPKKGTEELFASSGASRVARLIKHLKDNGSYADIYSNEDLKMLAESGKVTSPLRDARDDISMLDHRTHLMEVLAFVIRRENLFSDPLEDMPLLMGSEGIPGIVARWRLEVGK